MTESTPPTPASEPPASPPGTGINSASRSETPPGTGVYREPSHWDTEQPQRVQPVYTTTQDVAAMRRDVVFDPEIGNYRHLHMGEAVTPSTIQAFRLADGSYIDLPLHMAAEEGLTEWDEEAWGPRVNREGFTKEEQDEIDQMIEAQNESKPLVEGMSDETPLEVTTFNALFVAHDVGDARADQIVDHLDYASDGRSFEMSEHGERFMREKFGIENPVQYVSSVIDAGMREATKAVGPEGIQQLRTAALYNDQAAADIKGLYKTVLSGKPFTSELRELVNKWSR